MTQNVYQSPESSLVTPSTPSLDLPSPIIVAFWLILATFLTSMVLGVLEYFLGISVPGNTFISTFLPTLSVGSYYGTKRGNYFPRAFRFLVVALWTLISFIFTALFIYFALPGMFSGSGSAPGAGIIILGIVFVFLLSLGLGYFALWLGENIGVKNWEKKNH